MKKEIKDKIKKYSFEFLTIFIGVFAAFALDRWNDNRRDKNTETKILMEIQKGLKQDFEDMSLNIKGHKQGIMAVDYFKKIISGEKVETDSLARKYFKLFRSFVSQQNVSGYEALKSKGLELVENDSLRSEIIALYENYYSSLKKLEENYPEMQFNQLYFKDFNEILAPKFIIDKDGIQGINYPIQLTQNQRNILLSDLWMIKANRDFILKGYEDVEKENLKLQKNIEKELKR